MRWFPFRDRRPLARARLFCFPFAGGGAALYRTWSAALPPELDVVPVELPGRGSRFADPPYTEWAPLLDGLVEAISTRLELPFAFFGYSMGGKIAFELSRRLHTAIGREPSHLFLAASGAPDAPRRWTTRHDLPRDQLVAELRRLGGTPAGVLASDELLDLFLPVIRADFRLTDIYAQTPGPTLSCPITCFRGMADQAAHPEDVPLWRPYTVGRFRVESYPEAHFFIEQRRDEVLAVITQELQAVLSR